MFSKWIFLDFEYITVKKAQNMIKKKEELVKKLKVMNTYEGTKYLLGKDEVKSPAFWRQKSLNGALHMKIPRVQYNNMFYVLFF